MKTLIIPDLHGKTVWKEAIQEYSFDAVIFLGDYVDASWEVSDELILSNLTDIIEYKKDNFSTVILLLGNHDVHYMYYPAFPCSGFRKYLQPSLSSLFQRNKDLFNIAFQHNNLLFTHAGVSEKWYNKHKADLIYRGNMAQNLNAIHATDKKYILHEVGQIRGGFGDGDQHGGPTWADKTETMFSMLKGYQQIVGHSKVLKITKRYLEDNEESDTSFTYCDCLNSKIDFLTLNIEN